MSRLMALVLTVLAGLNGGTRQRALWQADLQIRSLTISEANGNLARHDHAGGEISAGPGDRLAPDLEEISLATTTRAVRFPPDPEPDDLRGQWKSHRPRGRGERARGRA